MLRLCAERGPVATEHEFPETHVHYTWDVGNEPVLSVQSGDTVILESRDVSYNQLTPSSTSKDIETLDWDRVYPLSGPIAIAGCVGIAVTAVADATVADATELAAATDVSDAELPHNS